MTDEIKKYLHDIRASISAINDYLGNDRNFFNFQNNRMMKKAIEREFEIIGEAVNKALKIDKNISITSSRKIVDLRNYLAHAYDTVDYSTLWAIISKHLPKLEIEINNLLNAENE
ncbi:MAG: hypothetical protein A2033_02170 [Bacteroidetes bacterium GWA2_31_9]|nr:MAG: hypothetical protein A2033_02170 [Bacteroidetes bacterium GWA2_31_9]